jgi:LPS-assembly protein
VVLNFANDFRYKRARGERDISETHVDLSLMPARWMQFDLYQSFAPRTLKVRELNSALTLRDGMAWVLRFSSNYLRGEIEDYLVDGRVRLTESYEAVTRLHYDARRSRFNEQAYGIAHNIGNTWLVSYTVSLYSGRRRESSFGFNVQIDTVRF